MNLNNGVEKQEDLDTKQPNPPALTYHGRNILCRVQGFLPKKIYKFDEKNKFTLIPDSFEDFYLLVAVNGIVLVNDPKAKDVRGRPNAKKSINEVQRARNIEAALELERTDRLAEMKKFKEEKVQEKMESFGHDIANGLAEKVPVDAKEQAKEYANEETTKKFGPDGIIKVILPKMRILPGITL